MHIMLEKRSQFANQIRQCFFCTRVTTDVPPQASQRCDRTMRRPGFSGRLNMVHLEYELLTLPGLEHKHSKVRPRPRLEESRTASQLERAVVQLDQRKRHCSRDEASK